MGERVSEQKILIEQGEIISVEEGVAYVQVQAASGCNGCASSSSCGTSALAGHFKGGARGLIKVNNHIQGQVGDQVVLKLDQSQLVKQAFMAYGLPLLGLFICALFFGWLGAVLGLTEVMQELVSIVGGFLGVGLGWGITRKIHQPVLPEMVEVLPTTDTIT
jgi:sigma-E factor negative regulatory protein RseC